MNDPINDPFHSFTSSPGSIIRFTLDAEDKPVQPGRLNESRGQNTQGVSYGFTNYYMTQNEKPYIPVVGEFHFSRFDVLQWEEELLKMKAGGVHIVASYIFWNFHEELEGQFNWSGNMNLRQFVELCGKHQLPLILRIGPFCHGEVRNGGLPDWLFNYSFEVRSNDEGYLYYAERLYQEITRQIKGCFYEEGGPILAIQLENEYMHAGAPMDAWGYSQDRYISSGRDGKEHMDQLRYLAEKAGMKPIFYTATAWGKAAVPEQGTLPMLAGYAYTPWIPNQPPSGEFLFRDLHLNPVEEVDYDSQQYPSAYCELAGGMQVSYHARPVVDADSIEAMTIVKLASGSNLVGYYMYHGGSNPIGHKTYMNERGLPRVTYDYQAPLGEFGRIGESYDRIRILSMFLDAYGEMLAPMGCVIPEQQHRIAPGNTTHLRWALRQRAGAGFLFINNYQDHVRMPTRHIQLELGTSQGQVRFPQSGTLQLQPAKAMIFPFHLNLGGMKLISATVQPLTTFTVRRQHTKHIEHTEDVELTEISELTAVFYVHEDMTPEYVIDAAAVSDVQMKKGTFHKQDGFYVLYPMAGKHYEFSVTTLKGHIIRIMTLTREEALQSYLFELGGEKRLVISSSHLHVHNEQLICTSAGQSEIKVSIYPAPQRALAFAYANLTESKQSLFTAYTLQISLYQPRVQIDYEKERAAYLNIDTCWPEQVNDLFVEVDYEGDVAAAYIHQQLLTDHIQYGQPWKIGLKQSRHLLHSHALRLLITPLRKGTTEHYVNQAYVERFHGVELGKFQQIRIVPHYRVALKLFWEMP